MKTKIVLFKSTACLFIITCICANILAQESFDQRAQQLDLKLQLLDSKLDLLDSKIKLWESKPEELDIRLQEFDERVKALEFEPDELNTKFHEIDSMIRELKETLVPVEIPDFIIQEQEVEYVEEYKTAIMLNPVRLFEGTFHLSYERKLTDNFSISVAGLATYATEEGLTNYFFRNQSFRYLDASSNTYRDYNGESIAGGGIILQCKNYLLAHYPSRRKGPLGLYAAPQLLYRRILITGERMEYNKDKWEKKVIKQPLNILSTGVILGTKIPFMKVLFMDIFIGGNIKLSKYDKEAGLTKYKEWYNIDFSGVFPTAGIGIGILK